MTGWTHIIVDTNSSDQTDYKELARTSKVATTRAIRDHEPNAYWNLIRLVEKEVLATALRMTGGNQTQAARVLGISRLTLRRKCKELGIPFESQSTSGPD